MLYRRDHDAAKRGQNQDRKEDIDGKGLRNADRNIGNHVPPDTRTLGTNAQANRHTAGQHRKFQCKIKFSVPVQYDRETGRVLASVVPGAHGAVTRQHALHVKLRISDIASREASVLKGEAHHAAHRMRQHLVLMNRLLSPLFTFPADAFSGLGRDQDALFR